MCVHHPHPSPPTSSRRLSGRMGTERCMALVLGDRETLSFPSPETPAIHANCLRNCSHGVGGHKWLIGARKESVGRRRGTTPTGVCSAHWGLFRLGLCEAAARRRDQDRQGNDSVVSCSPGSQDKHSIPLIGFKDKAKCLLNQVKPLSSSGWARRGRAQCPCPAPQALTPSPWPPAPAPQDSFPEAALPLPASPLPTRLSFPFC